MSDADLWELAARNGLPWFRFLRRLTKPEQLDAAFVGGRMEADWLRLKARMQPGDKIWPFEVRVRRRLGMRSGYVVLRKGKPIGGLVTVVS